MTWITELIDNIQTLIEYIAPGFLLASSFMWIVQKKFESATVQLVSSIVISFFVWSILKRFKIPVISLCALIVLCAICCVLGLIIGKIYKSERFNRVLGKLKLDRTTNTSIIEDSIGKNSWVAFLNKDDNCFYCGQFRFGNTEGGEHYISIVTYYVLDNETGEVKEDYRYDVSRQVVFNMNNNLTIISKEDPFKEKHLETKHND